MGYNWRDPLLGGKQSIVSLNRFPSTNGLGIQAVSHREQGKQANEEHRKIKVLWERQEALAAKTNCLEQLRVPRRSTDIVRGTRTFGVRSEGLQPFKEERAGIAGARQGSDPFRATPPTPRHNDRRTRRKSRKNSKS